MFNTLYGWYLKEELSCVFDTLTFTDTLAPHQTKTYILNGDGVIIGAAVYGDLKKSKLGTFNFIITRIFTATHSPSPVQAEIFPDGDLLQGFTSMVYVPRVVEPETPIIITMDLQMTLTEMAGAAGAMTLMVFEGFWIPKTMMDKFVDMVDMVVTSPAKIDAGTQGVIDGLEDVYNDIRAGGAGEPGVRAGRMGMPSRGGRTTDERVPFCKRRRF